EALEVTNWKAPRGSAFVDDVLRRHPRPVSVGASGSARVENFVDADEFSFDRISFGSGDVFEGEATYGLHGLLVWQGEVAVTDLSGREWGVYRQGQPIIVPAHVGQYRLIAKEQAQVFVTRSDPRSYSLRAKLAWRDKQTNPGTPASMTLKEVMVLSAVEMGTSGARGLVKDMTDEDTYANTRAFLQLLESVENLQTGEQIGVAGDLRDFLNSTNRIMRAVGKAIADKGLWVVNLGKVPTQAAALWGAQTGHPVIMVTGSHIPDDRNGIKFYLRNGRELLKEHEAPLKGQVVQLPWALFGDDGQFKSDVTYALPDNVEAQVRREFVDRYLSFFGAGRLQGLNLGHYQH
ncbi:MAG TPA: hypothetical protein VJC18_08715, partial [bacterium]|nr:hypothetical protein [bacterium]